MLLHIQCPNTYQQEREYIFSVLLNEFLGLEFEISYTNNLNVVISGDGSKQLIINDFLFSLPETQWLMSSALPQLPLENWNMQEVDLHFERMFDSVPVIYGLNLQDARFFQDTANDISLGLDIFGSAFFMLTRYEELVKTDRDRFDRFPAKASLAFQAGFLERPIINEYLEILWACLNKLWPDLKRKPHHFQMQLTHDVDCPYLYAFSNPIQLGRCIAKCLLKRQAVQALHQPVLYGLTKLGNDHADPAYTFSYIMDLSEKHNLLSTFYFMSGCSEPKVDGNYSLSHPRLKMLLRRIYDRGHTIGLHASFNSFNQSKQLQQEFAGLLKVCDELGVQQSEWGSRQHYLRWSSPETFSYLNDTGLSYDSTLTFADHVGFRCGVCYPYSVFDLRNRQHLSLVERPLIAMDVSLLSPVYMALNADDALEKMNDLKKICQFYQGVFILLWHNNRLIDEQNRKLYESFLQI